jgi:hypothetical protein
MSQPEQPFISSADDESSTRQSLEYAEVTEASDIQDLSTGIVEEKETVVNCIAQLVVGEQPRRMIQQISLAVDDVLPVFPQETVSVEPTVEPDVGTMQASEAVAFEQVNELDSEPRSVDHGQRSHW